MTLLDYIALTLFRQYANMLENRDKERQRHQARRIFVLCNHLRKNHPEGAMIWELFMAGTRAIEFGDMINGVGISLAIMQLHIEVSAALKHECVKHQAACN